MTVYRDSDIEWLSGVLDMLKDGATWICPVSTSVFTFDKVNKLYELDGDRSHPTNDITICILEDQLGYKDKNAVAYDSVDDTMAHIDKVRANISQVVDELNRRAVIHDNSKLRPAEKSVFDEVTPALAFLTYGSDEYNEQLAKMKPALDHHYEYNRHHPEHFENGLEGMTLVDLVEMFCDWCAATERHRDGDIHRSIGINSDRFEFEEPLRSIMHNTAKYYEMGKEGAADE